MKTEEAINELIKSTKADTNKISNGYHTFEELYDHRIAIWIRLLNTVPLNAWRSKLHSDGTSWDGWFICGLNTKKGRQMSYHLPIKMWSYLDGIVTLDKAPEFDGHKPEDVIDRLLHTYEEPTH